VRAGFGVLTFKVIAGAAGRQTGRPHDFTAKVMHYPAGQWVVGIVGHPLGGQVGRSRPAEGRRG